MKKQIIFLASILLTAISYFAGTNPELPKQNSKGISFTEKKGQVHDQNFKARPDVLYGVMTGNMVVHIKKAALVTSFTELTRI